MAVEGDGSPGPASDVVAESDTQGHDVAAAEAEVTTAIETRARAASPLPVHLRNLPEQSERQDLELKKEYAKFIKWALGFELGITNAVFITYAWAGEHWKLDPTVINIWFGATVVQVVGIVTVVTRHLFPQRDKSGGQ